MGIGERGEKKALDKRPVVSSKKSKTQEDPQENRMPDRSHDTISPQVLPAELLSASDWEREVLPRLPKGWEEQARTWKAFSRAREIRHPADLLRGLLAYVLYVRSFRHLGCWSVLIGLADVSETDWRKRLGKARAWLAWMLSEVLKVGACPT